MAQTQTLKRRLRSVHNARQITKAMEMVAAARMRRVQAVINQSREYNDMAVSLMRHFSGSYEAKLHPFFQTRSTGCNLYVIYSSDRGLAGAFNTNVFHVARKAFEKDKADGIESHLIVLGKKGANFFSKIRELTLLGDYVNLADNLPANFFAPIISTITPAMREGKCRSVNLIYTEFRSTMVQQAKILQLLPVQLPEPDKKSPADSIVYEFEPSVEAALERALRLYIESALIRARIESSVSEYAMRMMSMNNAHRNAGDLIDNLTLELNASRQAIITQEIAEITGGSEAIAKQS